MLAPMARDARADGATFALADVIFYDFETRSAVPISHGTYRYATSADAIVLAYAIGAGEPRAVAVGDFSGPLHWDDLPEDFRAHHGRVAAGEAIYAAWNAGFDKAIWNFSTLGFPLLQPHHTIDIMVQAMASGLPPDLAGAAQALETEFLKDISGAGLIKLFCTPKDEAFADPESSPDEWAAFIDYAKADVVAARAVFLRTRQLPLAEWQEYWALEQVNERGVAVDLELATAAAALAEEDRGRMREEIARLTSGAVRSVDEVSKLTAWLLPRVPAEGRMILLEREEEKDEDGEVIQDQKHALTRDRVELLIAFLDDPQWASSTSLDAVRRVLQLRLYGGSRTPAKFGRMLQQHVDGVLFGQYVFNGAGQTGRMSSKGIQFQNLSRNVLAREIAAIDTIVEGGSWDDLAAVNPDPVVRQLSLLIRPALVPPGDDVFVWSDWSQIEARILPWLAGAQERLDIFREVDADPSVPDLYTRTAAALSRVPVEAVTKEMRQQGKVMELSLGYSGGVGALQKMAAAYGLHIGDSDARKLVDNWRAANGWCVQFWERLDKAAQSAIRMPGQTFVVDRLAYVFLSGYLEGSLLCRLPSGRCITYRKVRHDLVDVQNVAGEVIGKERQLRFSRGRNRVQLYKNILVENVTQSVAACCLRETLVRLEEEGFRTVLTTHDEVVVQCAESAARDTADDLGAVMCRGFSWSDGLPLMSEETISYRYTKSKEWYLA
jgi:DNA polymerase